jgi:drug/metabolite transporter (DMT)-like permease
MVGISQATSPAALRSGRLLLLITAIGWGLNWAVLKFVLHDWPPLFARGVAGELGAASLATYAILRGNSLVVPRQAWLRLVTSASINVFAWMGFTALSLNWLKVSEGALIAYSMPVWAMLLAWPLLGERPSLTSLVALTLGVGGVGVLMGGPDFTQNKLPGVLFALAAAVLFAIGTLTTRKPVAVAPIALTSWQVGLGSLPMILLSLAFEHPRFSALSPAACGGLVYMGFGPMALCYLTWFEALKRLPTAVAATGMLLVPIVGVLAAIPLLGDSIGARDLVAAGLTLSGVALALFRRPAGSKS